MSLVYVFTSVRSRGRKSRFLVKSDYDALLGAENVQAALRRLEGTPYGPYLSSVAAMGEVDVPRIEDVLMKSYEADLDLFTSWLKNEDAIIFLREFSDSLRRRCIAQIVKAIILKLPWGKASRFIHPYGRIDATTCKNLVAGQNIKNALKLMRDRVLERKVAGLAKEIVDPARQALEFELAVIKHSSIREWKRADMLEGRDLQCMKLLGITFDIVNIMTVLRMKKLGFKREEIVKYLIPVYYEVPEKGLMRAVTASTERDALKVFASGCYVDVISPLLSIYEVGGDLSIFETAFKRYHANECGRIFFQRFFHLTEVLAYLYMKLYEVRDLKSILVARHLGLPADKAERQLVLHQPPHPLS